jgi:hypothetical protein
MAAQRDPIAFTNALLGLALRVLTAPSTLSVTYAGEIIAPLPFSYVLQPVSQKWAVFVDNRAPVMTPHRQHFVIALRCLRSMLFSNDWSPDLSPT